VKAIIPVAVALRMSRAASMPVPDVASTSRAPSISGMSTPSKIAATRYSAGSAIRLCRYCSRR
jgi:hypothetical protein